MKKFLSLLLCFCFLLGLAACASEDTAETSDADITEAETEPPEIITIISGGITQFEIVCPEESTTEESNTVLTLMELFDTTAGVKLARKDDFLAAGASHTGETGKLLVGKTNYALSEEAYTDLMYQDFRILAKDGNVAVAAYTSAGFNAAVKWLKENVLSGYADGGLTMEAVDYRESLVSGYAISEWKINGNILNGYKIVYSDEAMEKTVVELRDDIAKKTGWYLDIGLDWEIAEGDKEILIGDTNREASASVDKPAALNYVLETVENKLVIKVGGAHSRALLFDNLLDIVVQDAKKVDMPSDFVLEGDFFDDPCDNSMSDNTDVRIMCANVMADIDGYDGAARTTGFDFARRVEIFCSAVEFYEPTVIGLQEFCQDWYEGVEAYDFTEEWEILKFDNPVYTDAEAKYVMSTIMYRTDLYNVKDSGMTYYKKYNNGRCRCITWAIFEDKATKDEFCIVSTHWDGFDSENGYAQAAQLAAFVNDIVDTKGIPVFTMGDFNSNEWTKSFPQYCKDIDSYDAMHNNYTISGADHSKRVNMVDAWHDWGKSDVGDPGGSGDHITFTQSDTELLLFETLVYNEQIWCSDHSWLLADFRFK